MTGVRVRDRDDSCLSAPESVNGIPVSGDKNGMTVSGAFGCSQWARWSWCADGALTGSRGSGRRSLPLHHKVTVMGRLKGMPSRLGSLPPRVAAMPKVAESFYKSAAWLAYRQQHKTWTVAQQGGVWCIVCGSTKRLILDHAAERKDGGADLPPNDQAHWYCTGCHNRKTAEAKAKRASGGR